MLSAFAGLIGRILESWLPILPSLVVLESIPSAVDDPDELADWAKDMEDVS